jgi:hypothetical protein
VSGGIILPTNKNEESLPFLISFNSIIKYVSGEKNQALSTLVAICYSTLFEGYFYLK